MDLLTVIERAALLDCWEGSTIDRMVDEWTMIPWQSADSGDPWSHCGKLRPLASIRPTAGSDHEAFLQIGDRVDSTASSCKVPAPIQVRPQAREPLPDSGTRPEATSGGSRYFSDSRYGGAHIANLQRSAAKRFVAVFQVRLPNGDEGREF